MKKNICLIAGLALLMFVWSGNTSFAADKIGFINMQEIIQTSNAGKKEGDELKKFVDKKQGTIKAMEAELERMKKDFEKQASVMTAAARADKENAIQKKMRDYKLYVDDSNNELQQRNQALAQKMVPQIMKSVNSIAEKEGYTLILDISSMPIPYYNKANNISKKVIEDYNRNPNRK